MRAWQAALAALAVLLAGCSARSGGGPAVAATPIATALPAVLTRWQNPAYPYEISYPAGWKPAVGNPDAVKFQGPDGRQLSISAQAVPERQPPVTLPAFADQQVEALRKSSPDLIELARNRIGLPNKQAGVEVDVMWGPAAGPHRALLVYALDSGVGYALRADAPAATFSTERRELDAALRSFTLTPPD